MPNFIKLKRRHYYSMQNVSLYMLSLLTIIPHPSPSFEFGSRHLACHIKYAEKSRKKIVACRAAPHPPGFGHPACTQKNPVGFFWVNPPQKTWLKNPGKKPGPKQASRRPYTAPTTYRRASRCIVCRR